MTKPLVLVFYDNSILGSQLVNRLHDLGYRAQVPSSAAALEAQALKERPLLIITELPIRSADIFTIIQNIRQSAETSHIPVLGFTGSTDQQFHQAARTAGATLVSLQDGFLAQLSHLLAQALEVE